MCIRDSSHTESNSAQNAATAPGSRSSTAPSALSAGSIGSSASSRSAMTIRMGSEGTVRTSPPRSVSQPACSRLAGSLRIASW